MTAVNAVPAPGADVEAQVGIVPGYYLSDAVQEKDNGATGQVAGMIEPNELIHVPGLGAGARWVDGGGNDGYLEPMLRYRHWLGAEHRLALAVVGYGTHASSSDSGASYSMTHTGGEVAFDGRLTPTSNWIELHVQAGGSVSGVFASGGYCRGSDGWATDCPDGGTADTSAKVDGAFPAFFGGASLDFARHLGALHGARVAFYGAAGQMPEIRYGQPGSRRAWAGGGVSLTLAVGAAKKNAN